ncbi:MAG: YdeI/OmpD-associated family protein, partial [Segetibacter sp.]
DALQQKEVTMVVYEKFSPSQKREYVEWVTEAKTDATRTKRMATALEWIAEGKTRNWKYAKC